jgi:hypothetical protein
MVGKLEWVALREVWAKEATDFNTWLFANLDILSEQIGFELSPLEREKRVGPFSVDILAEDGEGGEVIIENQLEKTDHDHLGKLLTYLSNLDAKAAIWISSDPRPEHKKAIAYLNENTPADTAFYLVRMQAVKIGDSEPAPLFTVEEGVSTEAKAFGKEKKEMAEREKLRYEFFSELLKKSKEKTPLFSNITPLGYQSWLWESAGKSGVNFVYSILLDRARVELSLYVPDGEVNKRRFENLRENRDEIEAAFGEALEWNYKEGRKEQRIFSWCNIGGLLDEDKWAEIQNDLVDRMVRLERALKSHITALS